MNVDMVGSIDQQLIEPWVEVEVGDLGEFVNGYPFKPEEWTTSKGDPIIRIQNLTDPSKPFNYFAGELDERYRVRRGDLLVSWSASLDAFVWPGSDAWLNQHIFRVTPNSDVVNSDFLYFLMKREIRNIALSARGSTMKHVTGKIFRQHKVALPPIDEQKRIARILSVVRTSIDTTSRCAESKRLIERAAISSMFPRSIDEAPSDVLGHEVRWFNTTVGDQLSLQRGFDITKRQQRPGQIPVVSSSGVKSFHDTPMASGPGVIIGRKGSLGTAFFVETDYWPHDTTLWVTDFKGNYPRFVYYFLKQLDVSHLDVGASNPTLNRNHLYPASVVWPDRDSQVRMVTACDSIQLSERTERDKTRAIEIVFNSALERMFSVRESIQ